MSRAIYQNINITSLLLNPKNPRFNPVEHQTETITSMVQDQQEKLLILARHIINNGLNPIDPVLVKPYKSQWLIREGNRRITALKLVNEPSLMPPNYPKLKRDFQQLSLRVNRQLLKNISCIIIEDEDEINEWVRLKHTGQNEGAGTVSWDGQQTSRFRTLLAGRPDMRLAFLDYLKTLPFISDDLKSNFQNIKKTNFDRLMGDPDVRNFLGVEIIDGELKIVNKINEYLLTVLKDLTFDNLSVGKIYHKEDRKEYVESIKQRLSSTNNDENKGHESAIPPSNNNITKSNDFNSAPKNSLSTTPKDPLTHYSNSHTVKKGSSYPINRKTLVPSVHKLSIKHPRILKIFNELKNIHIEDYPNATSVLFRAFIELSADYYITKNNLFNKRLNADSTLSYKIDNIATYMEEQNIMNNHQLRSIRQMTSSDTKNQSIKTFHSYVHNKDVTPAVTDLKSAWDDIWPFIEKIWE